MNNSNSPFTNNRYNYWYYMKYDDPNPDNLAYNKENKVRSDTYLRAIDENNPMRFISAHSLASAAHMVANLKKDNPAEAKVYYKKAKRWYEKAAMAALLTNSSAHSKFALDAWDKAQECKRAYK